MAEDLVAGFDAVSLKELDERAALLRRVDNKYAVERDRFVRLLERLRDDHQVLEIDDQRAFAYCTTYFDTPELRRYADHLMDRRPRFKARTRLYEDTGYCVFEVKLKSEDGKSRADRVLADLGLEPISLSKYRVGMSLVGGADRTPQPGAELFETAG